MRALRAVEAQLRGLSGVAEVPTTVEALVGVTLPESADPAAGQLIGIDGRQPPRLNRLVLRRGAAAEASPTPGRALSDGALPAWVSESFADARGLRPGSRVQALVNGRQRTLVVAGIALHDPSLVLASDLFGW